MAVKMSRRSIIDGDVRKSVDELLNVKKKRRRSFKKSLLFDDNYTVPGFQYVVHKKKKPKVAFLSGLPRQFLSEKKPLYTRYGCTVPIVSAAPHLSPNSYPGKAKFGSAFYKTQSKVVSKLGVGGLAKKANRFQKELISDSPAPNEYTLKSSISTSTEQNLYPFNCRTQREIPLNLDSPALWAYDIRNADKDHSIPFYHSFGGRTRLKPVVQVKCTPDNKDICHYCGEKPKGDYWLLNEKPNYNICTNCYMTKRLYKKRSIIPDQPKYVKMRDCSFMHSHEGTTATIPLITEEAYKKQQIKECYFSTYKASNMIEQMKPPSKRKKSFRKDIKFDGSYSNRLYQKMLKFINAMNKQSQEHYLEERNITNERMKQILTPLSLVPTEEILLKHLMLEQEPYTLPDYSMKSKRRRPKPYHYREIIYKEEDIICEDIEKTFSEEFMTMDPDFADLEKFKEYGDEISSTEEIEQYKKEPMPKPLCDAMKLIPITFTEHTVEEIRVTKKLPPITKPPEEPERIPTGTSELDLTQDPDIPPMERALKANEERVRKEDLDPDIASLMDESDRLSPDTRSLSLITIASRKGFPHLKLN